MKIQDKGHILKSRINGVSSFYQEKGRMPSFSEMGKIFKLKSKHTVYKVVAKLEAEGVIKKDKQGKLIPVSIKEPVRVLGTVEAGFPSPAEEELADSISLDDMLITNRSATFLLKVSGDSMIEAGIMPGDMVIVDKAQIPKNGDVVIAEVDGAWTMKFLKKRGDSVILIPANAKYKPIRPKKELNIAGVVTAVVRKYR
jgi:SOS regulatory protein LexA